jgi:acid phosphatase family membrane protein YuiD
MSLVYLITPFVAWFVAGVSKFAINTLKAKELAFKQVGYGGLPSNHSTIVTSMAALIGFREGIDTPAFGVAVTLAFIVMLDANSLRRQVGKQAAAINRLNQNEEQPELRERMGHTRTEIIAGILLGTLVGFICSHF